MIYKIIEEIGVLCEQHESVIVAIDGDAAAGKSTLAGQIAGYFGCDVIHMDDFFLPPPLRTDERMGEVGGNVHYERFNTEVATPLLAQKAFYFKPFDCTIMDFGDKKTFKPSKLTIIEGAYSLHPTLAHIYNYKIFMQADPTVQMQRIHARNGAEMAKKFESIWIPMEKRYQNELRIKEMCDIVL